MNNSLELIYFLLVDRFHPGKELSVGEVATGNFTEEQLQRRMGGSIRGVTLQLDYLQKLGCTAIWLSPVMENDERDYHGYAIRNFLAVDPGLGTLDDLKELVAKAHERNIRIYLDIVLNHTACLWSYKEQEEPVYNGSEYEFGDWYSDQYPVPSSLRNPDFYMRKGRIKHWDTYPETREGDIFELRTLRTDGSETGMRVREILFDIYAWWIRETNVDGFRVDTIKHLSPGAVTQFCDRIRKFARSLGKPDFLLFGEAIGSYSLFQHYAKQRIDHGRRIQGLNSLLDFPLHFVLPEVVSGKRPVADLVKLLHERNRFLAKMNADESMLIGFLDNHDQVAQAVKSRIHGQLGEEEVAKAWLLLAFICPKVQLYYGTEQRLDGSGESDVRVREPMYNEYYSVHSDRSTTFNRIRQIEQLRKSIADFYQYPLEIQMENEILILNRRSHFECIRIYFNFAPQKIQCRLEGKGHQVLWRNEAFLFSEEINLERGAVGILRYVQ